MGQQLAVAIPYKLNVFASLHCQWQAQWACKPEYLTVSLIRLPRHAFFSDLLGARHVKGGVKENKIKIYLYKRAKTNQRE
jgi:hypothetical protein